MSRSDKHRMSQSDKYTTIFAIFAKKYKIATSLTFLAMTLTLMTNSTNNGR